MLQPKIIKSSAIVEGIFTVSPPPFLHPSIVGGMVDAQGVAIDPQATASAAAARELLADTQAEAELILAEAREAAEAMLVAGRDRIVAEAEEARAAAHREGLAIGYAEGLTTGEEAAQGAAAGLLAALEAAHTEAQVQREHWFETQEKDLVKLALLIAQKIMIVDAAHGRDAALPMAKAALAHVTERSQLRLRVNPVDVTALVAARQQLALAIDGVGAAGLEIVGDAKVGLGGCLVETRTGLIDARMTTQFAEVAGALLDVKAGSDGVPEMDPVMLVAIRALGLGGGAPVAEASTRRRAPEPAPRPEAPVAVVTPALPEVVPDPVPLIPFVEAVVAAEPEVETAPEVPGISPALHELALEALVASEFAFEPHVPTPATPQEGDDPTIVRTPRPFADYDPSRRAAEALSRRLGQWKKGRSVATHAEEFGMSEIEGLKPDDEMQTIVKRAANLGLDIDLDQVLVGVAPGLEEAADALAIKLGKKPRRAVSGMPLDSAPGESASADQALGDSVIDQIVAKVVRSAAPEAPAQQGPPPTLEGASDHLAELLGRKKRKSNRPWYEQS